MSKSCGNCGKAGCFYKGITNPCNEWEQNLKFKELVKKAKQCLGKRLSFDEGRFVDAAVYQKAFSPKQQMWLESIHARVA